MRFGKSYFNATLFRKNMTRFWPIWGVYLAIWLFVFPIALILGNYESAKQFCYFVLDSVRSLGLATAVFFSILAAMAVWSYLYNIRSAVLMHTQPIRREGLFLTNYLSGLCFLIGPNAVIFVLTLLAEAAKGAVRLGPLCMWLACMILMELFFFSFATFCAMFTGHILCLPAFYSILCGLPVALVGLFDLTLSRFVYGYTGIRGLWNIADWLTPIWKLYDRLWIENGPWLVGLGYIIIYAFFGLVLAALALVVYRRRELERAGDVVTVPWVRPVFRYGVAFCCALALGTLLFELFRYNLSDSAWTLLFFMLLWGAIGYFVAEMLLEKSFRVLHMWKGCVPFLCALVLLVCVMEFDLTGYERRVPEAEDVAQVRIATSTMPYDSGQSLGMQSEDPEVIQAAVELHRAIAAAGECGDQIYNWEHTQAGYGVQTEGMCDLYLSYTLTNGHTITRFYDRSIPVSEALLADPDSPAAKLNTLVNLPQVVTAGYRELTGEGLVSVQLTYLAEDEQEQYWTLLSLSGQAGETLRQAVLADLAEGNLSRYLLEDTQRMENCYINDLEFLFLKEYWLPEGTEGVSTTTHTVTVGLQTTAVHTLAALEKLGALEGEVRLVTHAERAAAANQPETSSNSSVQEPDMEPVLLEPDTPASVELP